MAAPAGRGWGRRADLVARRKAVFSVVALLIIAVLSIPAAEKNTTLQVCVGGATAALVKS